MGFHELIAKYKKELELTQWAIIAGVSSLVYSEYIHCFKQKTVPTKMIMVPTIKSVMDLLKPGGQFMKLLADKLIDGIVNNHEFDQYASYPELILFQRENHIILQDFLTMYIIPNIYRSIPDIISKKFGLNDENQQLIRESREIDLFGRQPISEGQIKFVIDEIFLQLIMLLPDMPKTVQIPEDNNDFQLWSYQILTINNDNAICPIHFTWPIIMNESVIDLLKFVTSTEINIDLNEVVYLPSKVPVCYRIKTSESNKVTLTIPV